MRTHEFEKSMVSFDSVNDAEDIDTLVISFCNLTSLNGIEKLINLKVLRVYYCRNLTNITALSQLKQLVSCDFYATPNLFDYNALASCASLNSVSFTGKYAINSIDFVRHLPKLFALGLSQVKVKDGDYSPIIENKTLKKVFWFGGPFKAPALKEIKAARPALIIGGNAVYNQI